MGMEVIAVYDTEAQIESRTTSDFLAQILCEYIPKSEAWLSEPPEDDPAGKNWTSEWSNISEAVAEIERFLNSDEAGRIAVPDFTIEEVHNELSLFRDELRAASAHTSRFYLAAY